MKKLTDVTKDHSQAQEQTSSDGAQHWQDVKRSKDQAAVGNKQDVKTKEDLQVLA
jgi:hypothetical protein